MTLLQPDTPRGRPSSGLRRRNGVSRRGTLLRITLDRAMVLRQPWAQAVADGAFPAMVRSVPTNIRGWVGILASKNPDPAGFRTEAEAPLGAIVGAVELDECLTVEGDTRSLLADLFGKPFARFYPEHFIPNDDPKHVWVFAQALEAQAIREWDEPMPRTWARCNTWIEGDPMRLTPEDLIHA